jgi:hypothetical protein
MNRTLVSSFYVLGFSAGLVLLAGCGAKEKPPVAAVNGKSHESVEHEHAKGIKALGDHHARIAVEQGGVLKLFILGKDEAKVASIEKQEIKGTLRAADAAEALPVTLKADPQPGDPPGKTSQFVGTVPEALRGKPLIADLRVLIGGEPYRPTFDSVPGAGHGTGHGMPRATLDDKKERELFLTPGGLYSAADIAANGNVSPAQKFRGMEFHPFQEQEPELKKGDKLCPVTNNRADSRCSWIVNGKKYEFCCPPCLNKFVGWAKNQPEKIKDPEAYTYKE